MCSLDDNVTTGQEDRFRPSGSSKPFSIEETVELNINVPFLSLFCSFEAIFSTCSIWDSKPLLKLEFSVMVATVRKGLLYLCASELQSKRIFESFEPSQTCISLYACTRDRSTFFQAPTVSRKDTEEGVKLLARFEYWSDPGSQAKTLESGCDSISAVLRCSVTGDDSEDCQMKLYRLLQKAHSELLPTLDLLVRLQW